MGIKERYAADIAAILARQGDNGGALWATADRSLLKGAPFPPWNVWIICWSWAFHPQTFPCPPLRS